MAQSGPRKLNTHCSRIDDFNVRRDASEKKLRERSTRQHKVRLIRLPFFASLAAFGRSSRLKLLIFSCIDGSPLAPIEEGRRRWERVR
jgi:hypothetical protein